MHHSGFGSAPANRRNSAIPAVWHGACSYFRISLDQEDNPMFDRHFLTSKLGIAALVSVAMMVTFNVYALNYQLGAPSVVNHAGAATVGFPLVVLA
jgi:hypothetical protein